MAKACKKCDPHEICEECPEWIFTLADLIMCMMGLFVILWVLKPGMVTPPTPATASAQDQDDFDLKMGEFRIGMGYEPSPNSTDPIDIKMRQHRERMGKGLGGETTERRDTPQGPDTLSTSIRPGKQAVVGGRLTFDAGSTHFVPQTIRNLDEIANLVRGHRNIILVKGHTALDDLPDDASDEERMALSLQRAKSVADYLTSKGVEPEILRVEGCSTFEPVKQHAYTADALQLNRRVEVTSTSDLVEELQDRSSNAPATRPSAPAAPTEEK